MFKKRVCRSSTNLILCKCYKLFLRSLAEFLTLMLQNPCIIYIRIKILLSTCIITAIQYSHWSQATNDSNEPSMGLTDFDMIRVIGRGSYAKVLLVELKATRRVYAMKVIKKELVTDDEDIDWVQTEKHVFETASNHPFLVGLHSCFQTPSRWVQGQGVRVGRGSKQGSMYLRWFPIIHFLSAFLLASSRWVQIS